MIRQQRSSLNKNHEEIHVGTIDGQNCQRGQYSARKSQLVFPTFGINTFDGFMALLPLTSFSFSQKGLLEQSFKM